MHLKAVIGNTDNNPSPVVWISVVLNNSSHNLEFIPAMNTFTMPPIYG
jgi:hypothetical protein